MNKKSKLFIISTIAIVIFGLGCFLIGGFLAGWDFSGWFTSSTAYMVYIALTIYALLLVYIFLWDKIKNM